MLTLALALFLCVVTLHVVALNVSEDDLRSETFWRSLGPDLHVFSKEYQAEQFYFEDSAIDAAQVKDLIHREGYAQLGPQDWGLPFPSMVAIMEKLHHMGLPTPFCLMFDEFWFIYMRMHRSIKHILGAGYLRLPGFWAWRVDPANDERGWNVHRDSHFNTLYQNGHPKVLSIWFPLTDATTSNGCIFVIPADRDPTYRTKEKLENHWESIVPEIRALPVPAGSVLMWNQLVWHWGSRSNSRGTQPRYSLAFEFQAAPTRHIRPATPKDTDICPDNTTDVYSDTSTSTTRIEYYTRSAGDKDPSDELGDTVPVYSRPLSHPLLLHTFEDRLKLIAKQILVYKHMYPLTPEMQDLAERLFV